MMMKLLLRAAAAWGGGFAFVAALLFAPAGTLAYPRGWLLIAVLFIPMTIAGAVMLAKSPQLLRKRLSAKEKLGEQRGVIAWSLVMFVLGFGLAGLDFRLGLTQLPMGLSLAAAGVFLLGYLMYAQVLRENEYASRVVEVQENQRVIDTGLYAVVRHPMYSATVILFLSMPLVLGSGVSLVCFLVYPALIARRIRSEEQLLAAELEGYAAYRERVRWRLIPHIW